MSNLLKLILAVLLMLPAAFCVFGFWATFESGPPSQLIYRGAYAAVGLACLAAAGCLGVSAAMRRHRPGGRGFWAMARRKENLMKRGAVGLAVPLLPLLLSTGCVHDYSSPNRTGQGPDYARQVFSLYDPGAGGAGGAGNGAARGDAMKFPASVAVAEVGELHPPPILLDQLRKEPGLFRRVEGIPGIADGDAVTSPFNMRDYPTSASGSSANRDDAGQAAAAMRRLIRFARDMGMDYLMLFGATVDSDAHATELSAFDLTIVGAYVVPSRKLSGRARASAVLVDLRGDRVVLSAGTEADGNRMVPAVTEEGRQESLVKKLRDQAFGNLGNQLIASCKARTGAAPGVGAAWRGGAGDPFAGASANAKLSNAPPALSGGGDGEFKPLPPDPVPARR